MVPRATEKAVAGGPHAARGPVAGTHWFNQTTLMQSSFYTLRGLLCKQSCGNIQRFSSDF